MPHHFRVSMQDQVGLIELELPMIVDAREFDRLNESVMAAVDGQPGGRWVLDLSNVKYIGSAMLGLMAAISRRERLEVARLLEGRIATVLQPFSLAHQRQATFDPCRKTGKLACKILRHGDPAR